MKTFSSFLAFLGKRVDEFYLSFKIPPDILVQTHRCTGAQTHRHTPAQATQTQNR